MEPIEQLEHHSDALTHGNDVEGLWCLFKNAGDTCAREQLIEHYLSFARMLAAKLYARRTYPELEFHDYFQHASIGLIEAVDRFDLSKAVKFEAYASSRINGAILSGIETLSEKQEQVSARKRILASRTKALSDDQDDANQTSEDTFASLAELAIGLATGLMLDDSGMYQRDEDGFDGDVYQSLELRQLQKKVVAAVQSLKKNEQRVISYHYLQGLPFEEVSKIMKLSKGRVSQIHREGLRHLSLLMTSPLDASF